MGPYNAFSVFCTDVYLTTVKNVILRVTSSSWKALLASALVTRIKRPYSIAEGDLMTPSSFSRQTIAGTVEQLASLILAE